MAASNFSRRSRNLGLGNNKADAQAIMIMGKAGKANIIRNVQNRSAFRLNSAAYGVNHQYNTIK